MMREGHDLERFPVVWRVYRENRTPLLRCLQERYRVIKKQVKLRLAALMVVLVGSTADVKLVLL